MDVRIPARFHNHDEEELFPDFCLGSWHITQHMQCIGDVFYITLHWSYSPQYRPLATL